MLLDIDLVIEYPGLVSIELIYGIEDDFLHLSVRNISGSTPLHLAAATGHPAVVEYLLSQQGIGRVKAALDNEGKSPLAVCLEFRMNEWQSSAQLLRKSYKVRRYVDIRRNLLIVPTGSYPVHACAA